MKKCNCKEPVKALIEGIKVLVDVDTNYEHSDFVQIITITETFEKYADFQKVLQNLVGGILIYSNYNYQHGGNVEYGSRYNYSVKKGSFDVLRFSKGGER